MPTLVFTEQARRSCAPDGDPTELDVEHLADEIEAWASKRKAAYPIDGCVA